MRFHPALSSLLRHKVPVSLLIVQVAITLAVLSNTSYILSDYLRRLTVPSGIDESGLAVVKLLPCEKCVAVDVNARVQDYLSRLPGVQQVALVNTTPFGLRQADLGIRLAPDSRRDIAGAHIYTLGPDAFDTLGLELMAGRKLGSDDFVVSDSAVPGRANAVVSATLAARLWPDGDALGKTMWVNKSELTVIGVVRHLVRPEFELQPMEKADWSIALPMAGGKGLYGTYIIRTSIASIETTVERVRSELASRLPGLAVDVENTKSMKALRHDYLKGDIFTATMLGCILLATLLTAMLGIVGLTAYWVARRRRQIGVRRALGATRSDIAILFLAENGLIVAIGSCLGMLLAYGANIEMMQHYALSRLPIGYLPASVFTMLLIGQAAAFGPTLRATRVSPVDAIRNV